MRIVFNTRHDKKLSTRRLLFDYLARDLAALGVQTAIDDWDHYDRYDVAVLMCSDLESARARQQNPGILIGVVHPSDVGAEKTAEITAADFLIAGTVEERDYYLRYNPSIFQVYLIEDDWKLWKNHTEKSETVLGYHGNLYHLEQFYPYLSPALEALAKRYPIRLRAVYDVEAHGQWKVGRPAIPIDDVQWSLETLGPELIKADIGLVTSLAPIPDALRKRAFRTVLGEAWNHFGAYPNDYLIRFKNCTSSGRALVFMQLGIPTVSDMSPELCHVLQTGRTGFVAHSSAGWYDALSRLIESPALRTQIAANAKQLADDWFDRRALAERLLRDIAKLAEEKKQGKPRERVDIPLAGEELYQRHASKRSRLKALARRLLKPHA